MHYQQINLDKRSLNSFRYLLENARWLPDKIRELAYRISQTTQDILAMIELTEAQVVVTRKPRMIPLCAPTPALRWQRLLRHQRLEYSAR